MKSAFDYQGESIWSRDKELKKIVAGNKSAKTIQQKRGVNYKNQVFVYTKPTTRNSNGSN